MDKIKNVSDLIGIAKQVVFVNDYEGNLFAYFPLKKDKKDKGVFIYGNEIGLTRMNIEYVKNNVVKLFAADYQYNEMLNELNDLGFEFTNKKINRHIDYLMDVL